MFTTDFLSSLRKVCHTATKRVKYLAKPVLKSIDNDMWRSEGHVQLQMKLETQRKAVRTWVILHHDRGHAPVSRVVGLIRLSVGVAMHVGHVPLVLC